MSKKAQDNQVHDPAVLLKAVRENEAELPGVAPYTEALEGSHAQAVGSLSRRRALVAAAKEATQHLHKDLAASREAAVRLRHYIKSVLGFRTEKLRRYGIKPRRRPIRKRPFGCGLPS